MKRVKLIFGMLTLGFVSFGQVSIYSANNAAAFGSWTFVDGDGDSFNWSVADVSSVAGMGSQGDAIRSFSSNPNNFNPLTPNNLAVSLPLNLTNYSNVTLSWNRGAASAGLFAEKYAVYAVSAANQSALIVALATATPIYEETIAVGQEVLTRTVDLSSLDGTSNVYIVFRHFDCTGQFFLMIDDVLVEGELDASSSLENVQLSAQINVFPNPVNELLTIETEMLISEVSLLDQHGKTIYFMNEIGNSKHEISMQGFSNGVYFVKVLTSDGFFSLQKCVK